MCWFAKRMSRRIKERALQVEVVENQEGESEGMLDTVDQSDLKWTKRARARVCHMW